VVLGFLKSLKLEEEPKEVVLKLEVEEEKRD